MRKEETKDHVEVESMGTEPGRTEEGETRTLRYWWRKGLDSNGAVHREFPKSLFFKKFTSLKDCSPIGFPTLSAWICIDPSEFGII